MQNDTKHLKLFSMSPDLSIPAKDNCGIASRTAPHLLVSFPYFVSEALAKAMSSTCHSTSTDEPKQVCAIHWGENVPRVAKVVHEGGWSGEYFDLCIGGLRQKLRRLARHQFKGLSGCVQLNGGVNTLCVLATASFMTYFSADLQRLEIHAPVEAAKGCKPGNRP